MKRTDQLGIPVTKKEREMIEYISEINGRSMSNQIRYLIQQEYHRIKSLAIR